MKQPAWIITGVALGALLTLAAGFPTAPAVIASVDLEKVYRSLDQIKAYESKSLSVKDALEKRLTSMNDEIRGLQEDLDSYQVGSPAHNEAQGKVILKAGDLSALQNFAELKMQSEQANTLRETYGAIRSTCATLSKEHKIDFILLDDTIPTITPSDVQGTMAQINGRRLLFSNPALDITDLLIERMNADFRAANPTAAPAPAAAPAASATKG